MADLKQCDVCQKTAPANKYSPEIPDGGWYRLSTSPVHVQGEQSTTLRWWACCLHCLFQLVSRLVLDAPQGGIGTRITLDDEASLTGDRPKEAPHA